MKTSRPDFATLGGLAVAITGIAAGLILEGGRLQDVAQFTAAIIVLGGTLGAVMITTPQAVCIRAARQLRHIFIATRESNSDRIEEIIALALQSRKFGIVSLDKRANDIPDPFLRKALELAVDGIPAAHIRDIMQVDIELFEQDAEAEARVFEMAGGYAPTIGILGAVLGLIQVMKHLADLDAVGRGIAVAFVATLYGVGSANLFFLPAANKLRARTHAAARLKELTLEGVIGIAEGVHHRVIRRKLETFLGAGAAPPAPALAALRTAKSA
jgi:chemotaxis protein MotA